MRCLFFGAGGYLGRNLVAVLRQKGHEVIFPPTTEGTRLDLTQPASLANIDWSVDAVYLFAGVTGTRAAFDHHEKFLLGNELILLNILNSIRNSSMRPRVIFPSTRLVYLGSESLLHEGADKCFKTIYAVNKMACENYLAVYANAFDIPYTVLRICVPYANLIGDHYSFGTVGSFINQARSNKRIVLYGGGNVRRTLTHVGDLCSTILLASQKNEMVNGTYNIPGEDMSLYEAASLIAARFGASVESVDWPAFDARIESGSTVFDGSRLLGTLDVSLVHRFDDWISTVA